MLLQGAAITVAVNTGIALALWWAGVGPLDVQLVVSHAIGLTIWSLMNAGARWLARPSDPGGFPRGWRAVVLVPSVVLTGAAMGFVVGGLYSGQRWQWAIGADPRMAWAMLAITAVAGSAMTLYFYLAGKSSYLQTELERTQRQTAEARLRLLESQLEPHMMFNTLANLRVLIGLDPPRAQAMLDHLIAYLRSTLAASRSGAHPLSQEFERLSDYLALMAIRMGPRLQTTLELPDGLRDIPVPPLLLQPLVENAIHHGLEPCVAGGLISVRAWSDPSAQLLHLQVTDTGQGLPAHGAGTAPAHTTPPTPQASPTIGAVGATGAHSPLSTQSTGFGLAQVRERLATTYGPAASLTLIANNPTGTSANVQIPL
jgi:signal transduction histidine kinase